MGELIMDYSLYCGERKGCRGWQSSELINTVAEHSTFNNSLTLNSYTLNAINKPLNEKELILYSWFW